MDLSALQQTLREFAAERDWQPFHTPKNLAMALMIEAAELAEIFQWMTPEQSQAAHHDHVTQERISDEVADVLLYLLQVADHSAVDLKRAVGRKLVKNARKHPPVKPGVPVGPKDTALPQTHVLVDWENVQPKDAEIRALVSDVTDVWLFHGPNQRNVDKDQTAFGDRVTCVPISRAGKNALDFHLSFYMGYIASRNPAARFVVLSNDQGYGPMLEHAVDLGFSATLVGFSRGGRGRPTARGNARGAAGRAAGARQAPARGGAGRSAPPRATGGRPTLEPAAAGRPAPAAEAAPPRGTRRGRGAARGAAAVQAATAADTVMPVVAQVADTTSVPAPQALVPAEAPVTEPTAAPAKRPARKRASRAAAAPVAAVDGASPSADADRRPAGTEAPAAEATAPAVPAKRSRRRTATTEPVPTDAAPDAATEAVTRTRARPAEAAATAPTDTAPPAPAAKRARRTAARKAPAAAPAPADEVAAAPPAAAAEAPAEPIEPPVPAKKARAGKKAPARTAARKTAPAATPPAATEAAAPPPAAAQPAARERAPQPPRASQPPARGGFDLEKALRHVEASLRKTANKPARRARLLATIRSLLGQQADEAHTLAVLQRLLDAGRVSIDGQGAVGYAL